MGHECWCTPIPITKGDAIRLAVKHGAGSGYSGALAYAARLPYPVQWMVLHNTLIFGPEEGSPEWQAVKQDHPEPWHALDDPWLPSAVIAELTRAREGFSN